MNLAQEFFRKASRTRSALLNPVTYTKTIFKEKSSKIGSTSDGDDSDDDKRSPPVVKKTQSSSSSSDSSSSDEDVLSKKSTRNEALLKLNDLLKRMVNEDVPKTEFGLKLAQPVNRRVKKTDETVKTESVETNIINAAKDVAASLGGDVKQTESELISKLLTPVEANKSLSDILKGMEIVRESKPQKKSRASQVRQILKEVSARGQVTRSVKPQQTPRRQTLRKTAPQQVSERINLFEGDRLGIFTDPSKLQDSPQLETLQKCQDRDLKLAVTHPPSNYFQEMILWTEQGKLWKFPIDNEYGLEEEAKTYFADHIFLEKHLEPWCPTRGPIRHFMELVCVGLSKNPYLTVDAKKEYIEWYRKYFDEKKKLLIEVEAIPAQLSATKQIDS